MLENKNPIQKAHITKELTIITNKMIKEQKNTILETEKNWLVVGINANWDLEGIFIENGSQIIENYKIAPTELTAVLEDLAWMFNKLIPKIQEKRQEILQKYKPNLDKLMK